MVTQFSSQENKNFFCNFCDYNTCVKKDFDKHLKTKKHEKRTNGYKKVTKYDVKKDLSPEYICDCGRLYKYRQGLCRHKKTCNVKINENKEEIKDIVLKLMSENNEIKNCLLKENDELRKQLKDQNNQIKKQNEQITQLIPKIGNNNNNIKQKFNINVFLNEKCKDAISIDEFIDQIEISMKNLLTTKEKGQAQGISNIIIENMNKLSLYERPLHCTDKKRETLYIKNNEWEKDDNREHINKALNKVESKQINNIQLLLDNYSNKQEEYVKILRECTQSINITRDKIIKNLCNKVFLDKET
jgi:hypothetical protein